MILTAPTARALFGAFVWSLRRSHALGTASPRSDNGCELPVGGPLGGLSHGEGASTRSDIGRPFRMSSRAAINSVTVAQSRSL